MSALLAMSAIYVFSTLALGLFISTISDTQQQAMMTSTFFFLTPMIYRVLQRRLAEPGLPGEEAAALACGLGRPVRRTLGRIGLVAYLTRVAGTVVWLYVLLAIIAWRGSRTCTSAAS